jgi:hypothetical protein
MPLLGRSRPGPQGERGPQGQLPAVKLWDADVVHYADNVVAFDGGAYQAVRDTGKAPPHSDWLCLATPGREGATPRVRGTYSEEWKDYRMLDVVALNGGSFIARSDNPGPCPGTGWQLLASQGKRGDKGPGGSAWREGRTRSTGWYRRLNFSARNLPVLREIIFSDSRSVQVAGIVGKKDQND